MTDTRTGCSRRTPQQRLWITRPARCSSCTPLPRTGCSRRSGGVQPVPSRGAAAAPEPSTEPSTEPPAAAARAREVAACRRAGRRRADQATFFTALGDGWPMTARPAGQARASRRGGAERRLDTGYARRVSPARTLMACATRSRCWPHGSRPANCPSPGARSARPPWCGECDEPTRMLGFDGDTPAPCCRCRPAPYHPQSAQVPHGRAGRSLTNTAG